jgi:hypothetical protein
MFFPEARVRVYLYGKAVDMRKSFDGLYGIARAAFAGDPKAGYLYAFVSRSGSLIKVLYFDRSDFTDDSASVPFFDRTKVPVQTIEVPNPEVQGLHPDPYEVIGQKVSHRLAQRPGSYVVLEYARPVIKRLDTDTLHCPPAPVGLFEGSRADVSFVVGILPLDSRRLSTERAYEANLPGLSKRSMSPVSSAMVRARTSPMPPTVFSAL